MPQYVVRITKTFTLDL